MLGFFRIMSFLWVLAALGTLVGCGVKPDSLEPPPGTAPDSYPRTYPDTSTDPIPRSH